MHVVIRCAQCGTEQPRHTVLHGWVTLHPTERLMTLVFPTGQELRGEIYFCGMPCLAAWAAGMDQPARARGVGED